MCLDPYIPFMCCCICQNCLHGKEIQVPIHIVQACSCSLERSNGSLAWKQKCILEQDYTQVKSIGKE